MKMMSFVIIIFQEVKMNNKFKIDLDSLLPKDISDINSFIKSNPNSELVVNFKNTCGVKANNLLKIIDSPKIIFRVAGGYDEERQKRMNNFEYYENKNHYTRNELIEIVRTFEYLEREIKQIYSPIELAYFIYDKLRRYITYSHTYRLENKKDINSLLGIVYRKTSSYGFSLIYKEMMDRLGIKCYFVEGNGMRYAWNILEIAGRFYCVDLAYDSYLYHIGNESDCHYFGTYDKNSFNRFHVPMETELITDYANKISLMDEVDLANINKYFHSSLQKMKVMQYVRDNNTSFIISGLQILGDRTTPLYKYLYCDYAENGRMSKSKILLSEMNFFENINVKEELSNQIKYLEGISNNDNTLKQQEFELKEKYALVKKIDDYMVNVFLDDKKIENMGEVNYLGYFEYQNGEFKVMNNPSNLERSVIKSRKYRRDDGSVFIIERDKNVNGLFYYNYYEFVTTDNGLELEENHFITDNDLITIAKEFDKYIANVFFYKKRLLSCINELGGYLGYCNYGN